MSDKTVKQVDIQVGAPGAEKVPGLFARIGQEIHHMNSEARQGGFHGLETLLKGAGAAAIFKFGAEGITAGVEAWHKYKEGALSARDATLEAAKAVPVLGSVLEAEFKLLDLISGRAEHYAEALKENAERVKEFGRQQKEAKNFERLRDSAFSMQHPELGTPLGKLFGSTGEMDQAFKRLKDYNDYLSEMAGQEREILSLQERANKYSKVGGAAAGTVLIEARIRAEALEKEREAAQAAARSISMSPEEIGSLKQMAHETGSAMLDQFKDVAETGAEVFKKQFAPAFKFIADQFWRDMDKGQLDAGQKLMRDLRFKFNWPGGLGDQLRAPLDAIQDKLYRMWHPYPGKPINEGIVSHEAPTAEGRFLTGGSSGNTVPSKIDKSNDLLKQMVDRTSDLVDLLRTDLYGDNPVYVK